MMRQLACFLMTVSLAAAVLLKGGAVPSQWPWTALGVSLAACLALCLTPRLDRASHGPWGSAILTALLGWMVFQLVPLPPAVVAFLSPLRWSDVLAARMATGQDPRAWVALSVAPPATWERLLDVVPAMAVFLAAREAARWWAGRLWIAVAPVLAIAWLESLLGLAQFSAHRAEGSPSVTGTYVNYDHFAGLLELAFPLAVMAAVAVWRNGTTRPAQPVRAALRTAAMLFVGACLLMGVVLSSSRMAVFSTLAAVALTALAVLVSRRRALPNRRLRWLWLIAIVLPPMVFASLSTRQLVLRFADLTATTDLSKDTRMEIWADTLRVVTAYRWTGCGLGAYEHGLYRFKNVAPLNTVDFAHNDYLQILSELGPPGFLLVAALAACVLKRTVKVAAAGPGAANWEWAVGLMAAFLALGLHGLADFNLYIPANALALAWFAGVAVSLPLSPVAPAHGGLTCIA